MTSANSWFRRPGVRAVVLLLAVFGAGALVGLALDRTLLRRPYRALLLERATPPSVELLVERARRRLDLDSVQTVAVRELLERRQPLLVGAWSNARLGLIAQVDTTLDQLTAILSPVQQSRLLKLLKLRGFEPRELRTTMEGKP